MLSIKDTIESLSCFIEMWKYLWFLLATISQVLWFLACILIEGNPKFLLEVSEIRDLIFFPIWIPEPSWILTPELNETCWWCQKAINLRWIKSITSFPCSVPAHLISLSECVNYTVSSKFWVKIHAIPNLELLFICCLGTHKWSSVTFPVP